MPRYTAAFRKELPSAEYLERVFVANGIEDATFLAEEYARGNQWVTVSVVRTSPIHPAGRIEA